MRRGQLCFWFVCFNLQVCHVHRSQIVFLTDYSYYYILQLHPCSLTACKLVKNLVTPAWAIQKKQEDC